MTFLASPFLRLVAPYRAIPRDYLSDTPRLRAMGFLVSQLAIPPPPFLSVSFFESMRSGGAIPRHKRGISAILARYPLKTRQNACDTPLCDTISKGYCAIWGGISHWATESLRFSKTTIFFANFLGRKGGGGLLNVHQLIGLLLGIPRLPNGEGDFPQSSRWTSFVSIFHALRTVFILGGGEVGVGGGGYMREIGTMWQIGVLTGKPCTFLVQNRSFSAFWHYKNTERLSKGLDVTWHIPSTCLDASRGGVGYFVPVRRK